MNILKITVVFILISLWTCIINQKCEAKNKMFLKFEYGSEFKSRECASLLIGFGYRYEFYKIRGKTYIEYVDLQKYEYGLIGMNPFVDMYIIGQQFKFKNGMYFNLKHSAIKSNIEEINKDRHIMTDFNRPPITYYPPESTTSFTVGYEVEF